MVEMNFVSQAVLRIYDAILSSLPESISSGFNVFLFSIFIALISWFIWKFCKSLSKRDLIELNLIKYNTTEHPALNKMWATLIYFLENIIIMPVLISLWFLALAIFIVIVAGGKEIESVLILAAALIGGIRILAYTNSELAADLAKLFPFLTLSAFLLAPGALNFRTILISSEKIPLVISSIFSFLAIIFLIEIILRVFNEIIDFWSSFDEESSVRVPERVKARG